MISGVRDALIEYSEAYSNGARCNSQQGGPVGIWAWESDSVVIQNNRSHDNLAGGSKDGGGFDFDGGMTNSIMQDNASWQNDGAGYLLFQYKYAPAHRNIIVPRNSSLNDGRRNRFGGIHLLGALRDVRIEQNTVVMGPSAAGATPAALMIEANTAEPFGPDATTKGVQLIANRFSVHDNVTAVLVDSGHVALTFDRNDYAGDSLVRIRWGARVFDYAAAWRAATGQEPSMRTQIPASARPRVVSPPVR